MTLEPERLTLVTSFGRVDALIRRSARRTRTLQARFEGEQLVILAPARRSAGEKKTMTQLAERVMARRVDSRNPKSQPEWLPERARQLIRAYFPGLEQPASVTWATNQSTRWGSASIRARTIRLSHHLMGMPDWVVDSVLVHELAHLIEPNHGPRFQALCARYPRTEEAGIFLKGVEYGRRLSGGESADESASALDEPSQL